MNVDIEEVDYKNLKQASDLITLLSHYANDPMGGGKPLSEEATNTLVERLSTMPNAFSALAYNDGVAVGLANCFFGFSTFQCKPLVNIHDFVVLKGYRGNNISQLLLAKIEVLAKKSGCCKITLEVLEGNEIAQKAYKKFGLSGYELDPKAGHALFWEKVL